LIRIYYPSAFTLFKKHRQQMHAKLLSLALTLALTACAQAAPADTSTVWVTVPCPESSGSEQQDQPSSTPAPTTTPEKNAPHVRTKWSTSYYTTFTVTAGGVSIPTGIRKQDGHYE
jgi:hypothetical protein